MELLFTYGTLMKGQKAHNSCPDMSYISDQYCQTMVSMRQVKKTKVLTIDNEELNVWFYEYNHDVK